jgi:mRNA-degrading endonuclease RelE of RelBE toxin-antitoxin system
MSYNVVAIPPFDRQLKRLSKKYPSIKQEYKDLLDNLEINPELGTAIGNNCFKIRFAIESKGKGKRGGARVVTNFVLSDKTVFLLAIYDKAEKDDLSSKELDELLKYVPK